jgi:nucleoside-diphosphate-sugar epimerase
MALHVVVTGAGGFVGGFVARWLAARGCEVTAISRRPVGTSDEVLPRLAWREADLSLPGSLPRRFDALIHCAAETPERCPDPANLYRRNMDVSHSVFGQLLEARARSAVFLSSMSAYGTVAAPVVTEDMPPLDLDPYGRAKRDSENLLQSCVERGLESGLAIRLPGTVGKGSHDNFLSTALRRVLSGELVKARNPDAPFNNIIYVGDLAAFLEAWMANPRSGYTVTNLGASEPLPMREVLSLLFAFSGRDERVVFEPGGKRPFLISLERALSLGYRPATVRASLESFVRESI